MPPSVAHEINLPHLVGLGLADPTFMQHSRIDVLLGSEVFSQLILGKVIRGRVNEPIAMRSMLGWLISGNVPGSGTTLSSPSVFLHVSCEDTAHLNTLILRFWEQEEVPSKPLLKPDEQWCEDHFDRTHTRDETGRFIVRLPFKDREYSRSLNLGESVRRASAMFRSLEKKFQVDHELKRAYHEFIREFIYLKHMRYVEPLNVQSDIHDSYFLRHHEVW